MCPTNTANITNLISAKKAFLCCINIKQHMDKSALCFYDNHFNLPSAEGGKGGVGRDCVG